MKARGVERNVHTYTALMNVCIKCCKHSLALDTYRLMLADKCTPNVVRALRCARAHARLAALLCGSSVLCGSVLHCVSAWLGWLCAGAPPASAAALL